MFRPTPANCSGLANAGNLDGSKFVQIVEALPPSVEPGAGGFEPTGKLESKGQSEPVPS